MIQPEEIRQQAERFYPKFLRGWLEGEAVFPWLVRGSKDLDDNIAAAGKSVRRLRDGSKEVLGHGYTVEWIDRDLRRHGRNLVPQRIVFETQEDFLRYVGKLREFNTFAQAVERVRSRYPELEAWIRSNRKRLMESAGEVEGLLHVVDYLTQNPRPGLFAREIPIPVDTKFIGRNHRILREWLDRVLPHSAVRADEEHFERRYGLRYAESHFMVRFLDPATQRACGSPWPECSLPLPALASLPAAAERVLIVENKVNLLTLPPIAGTLALGGLGNGVTVLWDVPWLKRLPIWYWGDLDTYGFVILSRLRTQFPQTQSLLMDGETLQQWKGRLAATPKTSPSDECPANLTEAEHTAFTACAEENLRIEQERFPHDFVLDLMQTTFKTNH